MDMTFFTLIGCKNCNDVCLKRPKINDKEAGLAHLKKQQRDQIDNWFVQYLAIYEAEN